MLAALLWTFGVSVAAQAPSPLTQAEHACQAIGRHHPDVSFTGNPGIPLTS